MSRLFITLLLVCGALLQTLLPVWSRFGALEWPVLSGLVICIALNTGRRQMIFAAVLAGLLHDAFCPAPPGLSILFFIVLAAAVSRIRGEVFGDLPVTYVVIGASAAVFETLYYTLVFALSGLRPVLSAQPFLRLIGGMLAGATAVPLVALGALYLYRVSGLNRRRRA
jgi:rod shape-determining protein MreD